MFLLGRVKAKKQHTVLGLGIYLANLSIYLSTYLPIYLSTYLSFYLSIFLSTNPSTHPSIHPSLHTAIYPCFSLSVPSTAARQLFKDQLFSGSTQIIYWSTFPLSVCLAIRPVFLLHLSLDLFTSLGLSLCPYRLSLSTRLSTRLPPIILNQAGQKSRTRGNRYPPSPICDLVRYPAKRSQNQP